MADKVNPGVKITLDRERTLYLDLNGMMLFQQTTGKNPLAADTFNLNEPEILRATLWACLLHEEPTLKLEQAGAMVTAHNIRLVQTTLLQALYAAVFEKSEEGEKQAGPLPANRPPGKSSGKSGGLLSNFRKRIFAH